jgi:cyclic pyranopterin phosphate synthase
VNVVVMRGVNDDEIADFVELTRHDPINVRFIEYMPFDGNAWGSNKMVPYRELMAAVNERCVKHQWGARRRWRGLSGIKVALHAL